MPFASFIFKSSIPTEEGDSPAMNEGLQLNLLGEEGALIPNVCRSLKRGNTGSSGAIAPGVLPW